MFESHSSLNGPFGLLFSESDLPPLPDLRSLRPVRDALLSGCVQAALRLCMSLSRVQPAGAKEQGQEEEEEEEEGV